MRGKTDGRTDERTGLTQLKVGFAYLCVRA